MEPWTESTYLAHCRRIGKAPDPAIAAGVHASLVEPSGDHAVILPWPPSVNKHLGHNSTTGRFQNTAAWEDYKRAVSAAIHLQKPHGYGGWKHGVTVTLAYHPANKQIRDIDNPIKAILDALTYAGVWKDDNQVRELHVSWGSIASPAYVVVTIRTLGG